MDENELRRALIRLAHEQPSLRKDILPMLQKRAARPLHEIAQEIRKDWKPVNYAAKPYLDAMSEMGSIRDNYGADSGTSIVAYFLSNARSWKGETAKRIKAELNAMLKGRGASQKQALDAEMKWLSPMATRLFSKYGVKSSQAKLGILQLLVGVAKLLTQSDPLMPDQDLHDSIRIQVLPKFLAVVSRFEDKVSETSAESLWSDVEPII